MQWLNVLAWKVGDRGFEPHCGLQVSNKQMFLPRSFVKRFNTVKSLHDREVACSASDLCLEGSVVSFILPSSGGSPGAVYPICQQRWPKTFIHSFYLAHSLFAEPAGVLSMQGEATTVPFWAIAGGLKSYEWMGFQVCFVEHDYSRRH